MHMIRKFSTNANTRRVSTRTRFGEQNQIRHKEEREGRKEGRVCVGWGVGGGVKEQLGTVS